MKKPLLGAVLLFSLRCFAQCPFTVNLTASALCPGATLTVGTASIPNKIVWYQNGSVLSTVNAVSSFNPNGITVAGIGGEGAAANQLYGPQGVFVDTAENLFVSDFSRVQEWAPGATSGVTVAGGNGEGSAANQLNAPLGLCVDVNGDVFVCDEANYRVEEWMPGATSGITVAGGNGSGAAPNQLNYPRYACLDASGDLYVSDIENSRVQEFTVQNTINIMYIAATPGTYTAVVTNAAGCTSTSNAIVIQGAVTMISKNGYCSGDTLAISSVDSLGQIIWMNNGATVSTQQASGAGATVTVAGGNGPGNAANQLLQPEDAVVDAAGNVYVADLGNFRVQKWTPGAASGVNVAGGPGFEEITPVSIAVDGAGNLYVVESNNATVEKYAPGATQGVIVAGGNGIGTAENQLNDPVGVFVDAAGNVYVADLGNYRVQRWAAGATSGVTVAGGNGGGAGTNQCYPLAVFVDHGGDVYVNDEGNNRVQEWMPGAGAGITVVGVTYAGGAFFRGLWVDNAGDIFVVDYPDNSVLEYPPGSAQGITVAAGNGPGAGSNQLSRPNSVFVDAKGDIYVADWGNNRVQEYIPGSTIDTIYQTAGAGSYTATVITSGGCTINAGPVVINPSVSSAVTIGASATEVCGNTPVTFTAMPVNGGASPVYQWQVNGVDAGSNSAVFTSSDLTGTNTVNCVMTGNAVCGSSPAVSNAVVVQVSPTPVIPPNQVFTAESGGVVLTPQLSGDIISYSWTPAAGLSADTIADPLATPAGTTDYTLSVVSVAGCTASGEIKVKVDTVYTGVYIPNAFTPNGDGHNDIFYIPEGPAGSSIKDFSVFNRWGQRIFQVENAATGDPAFGWNGMYKGARAPTGAYVYILSMALAGGREQVFRGTVMLVR